MDHPAYRSIAALIADDHQLFRDGVKSALLEIPFIDPEKISEAATGLEVIEILKKCKHDVVFMDINMPNMNGIEATKLIKTHFPETKVIALTMYEDDRHIIEIFEAGAQGYLVKNTDGDEIKNAMIKVLSDDYFFSRFISENVIRILIQKNKTRRNHNNGLLSDREKQILQLICKEFSTKEIAEKLFLADKTVEWHRQNILLKTDSKNTVGLVLFAVRSGII